MITDRLTARVLGLLLLILPFLVDLSCIMFARPDLRARPTFALVVVAPSLPLFALGTYLLRRATRMKE